MTLTENNIFVSDEPPVQVPDGTKSLGHHIIKCLDQHKDKILFVDIESGRRWTGAQVKEKVLNIAAGLVAEFGFKQGTGVCLICDYSDVCVFVALGVICAGGFVSGLWPKDPYGELLNLSRKIEVKVLFCPRNLLNWTQNLERDMNYQVLGFAMDDQLDDNNKSRDSLNFLLNYDRSSYENSELPVACKSLSQDLAFVCSSSGTTGRPKAVPCSHQLIILEMAAALVPPSKLQPNSTINLPCLAALTHASGRMLTMAGIQKGNTTLILNGFTPESYLRAVEEYRVPLIILGATYLYKLISYDHLEQHDISSVLAIFPTGERVAYLDELEKFLKRHTHIRLLRQAYATTEISICAATHMAVEDYMKNSDRCGKLKPGLKAKIVDADTGKLLGKGQTGSLRVKTLFPGYIDVSLMKSGKQATPYINDSSIFDEDGYYITGDLAYFDDNEELHMAGREKELMLCPANRKVATLELEHVISEHPAVYNVSVLGVPSSKDLKIDCPRAFIVPTKDCYDDGQDLKLTERLDMSSALEKLEHSGEHKLCSLPREKRRKLAEDIMMFFNERVSWVKHLTGGIVLLDELPVMRPSGKVNKIQLKLLTTDQVEIYGDRST